MGWKPGTKVTVDVLGGPYTGKVSQTPPEHPEDVAVDTDQETHTGDNYVEVDPSCVRRR